MLRRSLMVLAVQASLGLPVAYAQAPAPDSAAARTVTQNQRAYIGPPLSTPPAQASVPAQTVPTAPPAKPRIVAER